jgi:dipeptidyl aminopeptidase/acylaminoacyl peptidase
MSTDQPRRAQSRKRRGRAFVITFAVVIAVLGSVGLAGAAASVVQGPRATSVQVDRAAAAAATGARLMVTTTQSLKEVDESQVTITPAAPFSVDTSGRSVGVRFGLPLFDDTEYTVRFTDVRGLGGGPPVTIIETFHTPPAALFLLQRTESGDTIFRTDLIGEEAVPVFSTDHIEDFRATSSHLVISARDGDTAQLIVTDLEGGSERELPLPGNGTITNLQTADRGELIGYIFSDADLSAAGGLESALFTASLKESEADADPTPIAVTGAESRVAEWRFVPDTDSILLVTFDGSLLLTGSSGQDATTLGSAISIDGIARGSSEAIVHRVDGISVIDLADASESPLVAAEVELGRAGAMIPVPGGGTVRIASPFNESGIPTGTTVAFVADDGNTDVLMDVPSTDAVLQTCVSPSGRYAVVLVAPEAVDNPRDGYVLPLPERVESRVVEISSGAEVVALSGFDISWCQVPPR